VYNVHKGKIAMPKRSLKSATLTARVAPKLERWLKNYARIRGQTKSKAIEDILSRHLDYDNWAAQGIREAIASADRGELIPHDEAVRIIQRNIAKRKRERRRAA
jgi:predicted transcriptional regulator